MPRGIGLVEALRAVVTEGTLAAAALVTLAGDAATLLALSFGAYWLGKPGNRLGLDRRRGAFVIACVLGALSLTAGLKALFSLPRPPGSVLALNAFVGVPFGSFLRSFVDRAASASGYGFPSGHAVGSTVTYGALALVARATRGRRLVVAGTVIALVSLSRVLLGVHYLVDVLVGCAVGLVYLTIVATVVRSRDASGPRTIRAFVLAAFVGVSALGVSAATVGLDAGTARDAVTLLGVSIGGAAVWAFVDDTPSPRTRRERLETVAVGLVVAGVPGLLTYVLDPILPIEFVASVAVGGAAIATPRLTRRGLRALGIVRLDRSDQNVSR